MTKATSKASAKKTSAKKVATKTKSRAKYTVDSLTGGIKKGLNAALISVLLLLVLGILLVVFPKSFLSVLRWVIAILFFLGGAAIFAVGFRSRRSVGPTVLCAILVAVGLLFALNEESAGIFSIVLGIWFIISSLTSATISSALTGPTLFFARFMSFISLVCGILMIINPFGGSVSIMMFLGIVTIVHAISSLIEIAILNQNINDLGTKLNSVIVEGEEVK